MKVIDLLNKIANGEEIPEYINYTHRVFGKDTMFVCKENIINKLDIGAIELNDEVEIIEDKPFNERVEEIYNRHIDYIYDKEDKKIEKLKQRTDTGLFGSMVNDEIRVAEVINKQANYLSDIVSTINEIIDYINKESK